MTVGVIGVIIAVKMMEKENDRWDFTIQKEFSTFSL